MTRPPLLKVEKFLLAALTAQFLFLLWITMFGTWSTHGEPDVAALVALFLLPAGLAIGAVVFILRRSPLGAFLCIVVHALQVVQWVFANGGKWNFSFFPTITVRVNADADHPVEINLLAIALTVISLLGYKMRRAANEASPAPEASG